MALRIQINADDCMSAGKCIADFPQGFVFDDDELAELVDSGAALSDEDRMRAARNCPSQAIMVFDDNNHQIQT